MDAEIVRAPRNTITAISGFCVPTGERGERTVDAGRTISTDASDAILAEEPARRDESKTSLDPTETSLDESGKRRVDWKRTLFGRNKRLDGRVSTRDECEMDRIALETTLDPTVTSLDETETPLDPTETPHSPAVERRFESQERRNETESSRDPSQSSLDESETRKEETDTPISRPETTHVETDDTHPNQREP